MHTTMDRDQIKKRLHELAGELPAEECQEGVRQLDKEIMEYDSKDPIQKFPSGNFWYFRTVKYEGYGRDKRNIPKERLGRISRKDYEKNEKIIDELMRNRDKDNIKKYLEQY